MPVHMWLIAGQCSTHKYANTHGHIFLWLAKTVHIYHEYSVYTVFLAGSFTMLRVIYGG